MRMSWKLGRVAGIDLFLHPTFLFVLAYPSVIQGGIEALLLLLAEADRALDEPVRAQDQVQPNDLQGPAYLGGTAVGPAYASDPVWLAFLNAVHVAAQRLREPPSAVFTRLFALVERRHKVA